MRIRTTIADLSDTQWRLINETVRTAYQFGPNVTRVCVIFKRGSEERHAEMPLSNYVGVLAGLGMASAHELLAALVASLPPEKVDPLGPKWNQEYQNRTGDVLLVRNDCAFCHRERTEKDNNHAPTCPYWTVGPGSL